MNPTPHAARNLKCKSVPVALMTAVSANLLSMGCFCGSIFQNGSFETGVNPPTAFYRSLFAGSTDIAGWVVDAGRIDWSGTPWNPKDGSLSIEMVGNGAAISQTFDTVSGQTYHISFSLQDWISPNPAVTVQVSLDGAVFDATIPAGPGRTWYDYTTTLTATSSSSTLTFDNVDGGYTGPFLDAVTVAAVPEPQGLAM